MTGVQTCALPIPSFSEQSSVFAKTLSLPPFRFWSTAINNIAPVLSQISKMMSCSHIGPESTFVCLQYSHVSQAVGSSCFAFYLWILGRFVFTAESAASSLVCGILITSKSVASSFVAAAIKNGSLSPVRISTTF